MKKLYGFVIAFALFFTMGGMTVNAQCASGESSVDIAITTDDFGGETSWELVNVCSGDVVATGNGLAGNTSYTWQYCVNSADQYEFTIFDAFGDGICCSFGVGSYSVSFDGNTAVTGGMFTDEETTILNPATSCAPAGCPGDDIQITVLTDDFGGETTWELVDVNSGAVLLAGGPYPSFAPATFTDGICAPAGGCYQFNIFDSFGDGICCSFGLGNYSVSLNGTVVGSGGQFGASESVTFGANCPLPPANDDPCGAEALACGQTLSGTTTNATTESGLTGFCGTTINTPGVWYTITPQAGEILTLSTCNQANYDTKISVFTAASCAGPFSCVTGQDDNFAVPCLGFTTELSFCADGSTYYVLVHGFGGQTGDFDLTATCAPGPGNDNVCSAQNVAVGSVTPFNSLCATAQPGEPAPGPGTSGTSSCNSQDGWCSFETGVQNSLWYTFQAPAGGCVSIVGAGFDTQLALYSAELCFDYGSFSQIAANDDSGDDLIPGATIFAAGIIEAACLTPGATYYVQLDGFAGASGEGDLYVIDCGNDPLAADAGACAVVFGGLTADLSCATLSGSASGGFPEYSYTWTNSQGDTVGTTADVVICPEATEDYTLTVIDDKGCEASASTTVTVVDIIGACASSGKSGSKSSTKSSTKSSSKSGSKSCKSVKAGYQKVLVCVTKEASSSKSGSKSASSSSKSGSKSGPKEKCMKLKSLQKKLNGSKSKCRKSSSKSGSKTKSASSKSGSKSGSKKYTYSLGPCGLADMYPDCNIAAIDTTSECIDTCDCKGGIVSLTMEYVGPNGGNIYFTDKCDTVGAYEGLSTGDFITLSAPDGEKLPKNLGVLGVGAASAIHTSCSQPVLGEQFGAVVVTSYTDGYGNTCPPIPPCVDLQVDILTDNFGSETTWEVADGDGNIIMSGGPYAGQNGVLISDTLCVDPTGCYTFTIFDSFGDGICCFWGLGEYNVYLDGANVATGGSFGSSEATSFGNCSAAKNSASWSSNEAQPQSAVVVNEAEVEAYPNPFHTNTTIKFHVPHATKATLEVYSVSGAKIGTLFNDDVEAGRPYTVEFDGHDLTDGIYFYTLKTEAGDNVHGKLFHKK